jgi:hypothetical protein
MPRPNAKIAVSTWYEHSHVLSEAARTELLNLLGFDPADASSAEQQKKAVDRVGSQLAAHPGLVKYVDHAPRTADCRDVLTPIRQRAFDL